MARDHFATAYQGQPPWDIPGPQPEIVALEEAGEIRGSVLDAGCGTGENALYLASRGHEVCGLDFIPAALDRACARAKERGISAQFRAGDALELDRLGRRFDTVIDCGLFHTFSDQERPHYLAGLAQVIRPGGCVHILCFSDKEPPGQGPRRITQQELRDAFGAGWETIAIRAARFRTTEHPEAQTFTPGGPMAWLATFRRV